MIKAFKKYQTASPRGTIRRGYLERFLPMMLYRTTKTEHPETTRKMVRDAMGLIKV